VTNGEPGRKKGEGGANPSLDVHLRIEQKKEEGANATFVVEEKGMLEER